MTKPTSRRIQSGEEYVKAVLDRAYTKLLTDMQVNYPDMTLDRLKELLKEALTNDELLRKRMQQ